MSKLQAVAWNRCWTPRVFRTAYRLELMLTEARGSLNLREEQVRGLTDRVRTDAAERELTDACEALGLDFLPDAKLKVWTISRPPGAMSEVVAG